MKQPAEDLLPVKWHTIWRARHRSFPISNMFFRHIDSVRHEKQHLQERARFDVQAVYSLS
jgi:hypothetical protein